MKLYFRSDVCYNEDGSLFSIFDKFEQVNKIMLNEFNGIPLSSTCIQLFNWQQATRISKRTLLASEISIKEFVLLLQNYHKGWSLSLRRFADLIWRTNCETNKKFVLIRVTRIIPAWVAGIELQRLKKQTRNENVNLQNLFTFWLSNKFSIWNHQNYQNWRYESKVFRMLQLALCKLKILHWNIDNWNLYNPWILRI